MQSEATCFCTWHRFQAFSELCHGWHDLRRGKFLGGDTPREQPTGLWYLGSSFLIFPPMNIIVPGLSPLFHELKVLVSRGGAGCRGCPPCACRPWPCRRTRPRGSSMCGLRTCDVLQPRVLSWFEGGTKACGSGDGGTTSKAHTKDIPT